MFKKVEDREVLERVPSQFRKYQCTFTMIGRINNVVVYERKSATGLISYEIMRLHVDSEGSERMPGSSSWGTRGFTVFTRERAFKKMEEIEKLWRKGRG